MPSNVPVVEVEWNTGIPLMNGSPPMARPSTTMMSPAAVLAGTLSTVMLCVAPSVFHNSGDGARAAIGGESGVEDVNLLPQMQQARAERSRAQDDGIGSAAGI